MRAQKARTELRFAVHSSECVLYCTVLLLAVVQCLLCADGVCVQASVLASLRETYKHLSGSHVVYVIFGLLTELGKPELGKSKAVRLNHEYTTPNWFSLCFLFFG